MSSSLDTLAAVYRGRRVLVTGHTGFKGAWLSLWLDSIGARVTGFALAPARPSLFSDAGLSDICDDLNGDVRDQAGLEAAIEKCDPEIVFHLAAQAIVRLGIADPVGTFTTNVAGTLNLLEAVRRRVRPCAVVVVTSDKVYRPSAIPHPEDHPLGGDDPYSASKAACEMVVEAYRRSFFPPSRPATHGVALATVRAGNVLGGGDWAQHRILPDVVRSLAAGSPVVLRNPHHVRPWQHVLEPLSGYLMLGADLLGGTPDGRWREELCGPWNFGPDPQEERTVRDLVTAFLDLWGSGTWIEQSAEGLEETTHLRLDSQKARRLLGWAPRWSFTEMIDRTASWYRAHASGIGGAKLRQLTLDQISAYQRSGAVSQVP